MLFDVEHTGTLAVSSHYAPSGIQMNNLRDSNRGGTQFASRACGSARSVGRAYRQGIDAPVEYRPTARGALHDR